MNYLTRSGYLLFIVPIILFSVLDLYNMSISDNDNLEDKLRQAHQMNDPNINESLDKIIKISFWYSIYSNFFTNLVFHEITNAPLTTLGNI